MLNPYYALQGINLWQMVSTDQPIQLAVLVLLIAVFVFFALTQARFFTSGNIDALLTSGSILWMVQALASYGPSWGRLKSITRPVAGNHEYGTPGAAGYFDYFNGVGQADGPAGKRGQGLQTSWQSLSMARRLSLPITRRSGKVWLRSSRRTGHRRVL